MEKYSIGKSLKKGALPLALVVLVNIAIQIAKANGIAIDEGAVWSIAGMGYSALVALINWLKNRKKGQPPKA